MKYLLTIFFLVAVTSIPFSFGEETPELFTEAEFQASVNTLDTNRILNYDISKQTSNQLQVNIDAFNSEERLYKSPLRQIRDDGISPQDVKCNIGKVLFFKIQTGSPLCIYERSIDRFDNTQIGWYDQTPQYFIELSDREYLDDQNSNLERTTFVNYKKDIQNNNILYNISEQITKQDESFLIHNAVFDDKSSNLNIDFLDEIISNKRNYSIVDNHGNDPVDWSDPRTSVKYTSGIEDILTFYLISCGDDAPIKYFYLNDEASFKILDDVETVHIKYPDKILTNYLETNTEFKDFVWSQGNAKFVFDKGLNEITISEYSCTPSDDSLDNFSWNSVSYLYEITFEVEN